MNTNRTETLMRKLSLPAVLIMMAAVIPFTLHHDARPSATAYHQPHRCTTKLDGCWMPPCSDHLALVGGSCYGPSLKINRHTYWIDSNSQTHLLPNPGR